MTGEPHPRLTHKAQKKLIQVQSETLFHVFWVRSFFLHCIPARLHNPSEPESLLSAVKAMIR